MIGYAMLIHVILNGIVCFPATRNPIWGELRLLLAELTTFVLWIVAVYLIGVLP